MFGADMFVSWQIPTLPSHNPPKMGTVGKALFVGYILLVISEVVKLWYPTVCKVGHEACMMPTFRVDQERFDLLAYTVPSASGSKTWKEIPSQMTPFWTVLNISLLDSFSERVQIPLYRDTRLNGTIGVVFALRRVESIAPSNSMQISKTASNTSPSHPLVIAAVDLVRYMKSYSREATYLLETASNTFSSHDTSQEIHILSHAQPTEIADGVSVLNSQSLTTDSLPKPLDIPDGAIRSHWKTSVKVLLYKSGLSQSGTSIYEKLY